MAAPSQRGALGALFLVLSALFGGIAVAAGASADGATAWVVVVAAGALAAWLLGLALRAFRAH